MRQLRVYNHVFRIEKTVYSIQGIPLPIPVSYRQMGFFVGSVVIMAVLSRFPPLIWVDYYLIKFVGIPFLVTWFFTRKTLDGKSPHRFILRYVAYRLSPHHLARYQELRTNQRILYESNGVYPKSGPGGNKS